MAAEDHGDAGGARVDVQPLDGVNEVDEMAGEFDGFGCGERGAGAVGVDVAADGGDGRDGAQGGEDDGVADVAGVEDVVHALDGGESFGAEERVGVGDGGDEHGLSWDGAGFWRCQLSIIPEAMPVV